MFERKIWHLIHFTGQSIKLSKKIQWGSSQKSVKVLFEWTLRINAHVYF